MCWSLELGREEGRTQSLSRRRVLLRHGFPVSSVVQWDSAARNPDQSCTHNIANVINYSKICWGSFTPEIYYAIVIAILFYGVNTNRIAKMGAQPILEPNGNRNRVMNLKCE